MLGREREIERDAPGRQETVGSLVTSTIYQWNHGYGTRTQLQVNRSWSQDVQATSRRLPFKTCWLIGPLPQIKQLGLQETCQQQPQLHGQCDKFFVFFGMQLPLPKLHSQFQHFKILQAWITMTCWRAAEECEHFYIILTCKRKIQHV